MFPFPEVLSFSKQQRKKGGEGKKEGSVREQIARAVLSSRNYARFVAFRRERIGRKTRFSEDFTEARCTSGYVSGRQKVGRRRRLPRRGDLSRFEFREGKTMGIEDDSLTYLPQRKRSTKRTFQLDRMRSQCVSPLLSSISVSFYIVLIFLFLFYLFFSLLYYHDFYYTICFLLFFCINVISNH